MLQHIFASVADLVHGKPKSAPEPQIGMEWYITHHRATPHYARGYTDGIASIQIVGVSDHEIEMLYNSMLTKLPRSEWDSYHEDHLRRARSANRLGGGSLVPEYKGIQPVHHEFVEMLKNPHPMPSFF